MPGTVEREISALSQGWCIGLKMVGGSQHYETEVTPLARCVTLQKEDCCWVRRGYKRLMAHILKTQATIEQIQERLFSTNSRFEGDATYLEHFSKGSIPQFTDYIPYFLWIFISADVLILFLLLLSSQFKYFTEIKK